jgi:hypothetical protein
MKAWINGVIDVFSPKVSMVNNNSTAVVLPFQCFPIPPAQRINLVAPGMILMVCQKRH